MGWGTREKGGGLEGCSISMGIYFTFLHLAYLSSPAVAGLLSRTADHNHPSNGFTILIKSNILSFFFIIGSASAGGCYPAYSPDREYAVSNLVSQSITTLLLSYGLREVHPPAPIRPKSQTLITRRNRPCAKQQKMLPMRCTPLIEMRLHDDNCVTTYPWEYEDEHFNETGH